MLQALGDQKIAEKTLVIVGAKHGQSPIDVARLHMMAPATGGTANPKATLDVTDPATLLANGGVALAQETADDVALLWLADRTQEPAARSLLVSDRAHGNTTRTERIDAGAELKALFGDPAQGRAPDIVIQPIPGTIDSASKKKIAEHGGFAADDTHVMLVLSSPQLLVREVSTPAANQQVAGTILRALGLDPKQLDAVRREGTPELPGVERRE